MMSLHCHKQNSQVLFINYCIGGCATYTKCKTVIGNYIDDGGSGGGMLWDNTIIRTITYPHIWNIIIGACCSPSNPHQTSTGNWQRKVIKKIPFYQMWWDVYWVRVWKRTSYLSLFLSLSLVTHIVSKKDLLVDFKQIEQCHCNVKKWN